MLCSAAAHRDRAALRSDRRRLQFRNSPQVERCRRHHKQPVDLDQAPQLHLAYASHRFHPPEHTLDARPSLLADLITGMARRPRVHCATAPAIPILRDVPTDAHLPQQRYEIARVIGFVRNGVPYR